MSLVLEKELAQVLIPDNVKSLSVWLNIVYLVMANGGSLRHQTDVIPRLLTGLLWIEKRALHRKEDFPLSSRPSPELT